MFYGQLNFKPVLEIAVTPQKRKMSSPVVQAIVERKTAKMFNP